MMTCFLVFDYWLIRKTSYPEMSKRQFLNTFLFSQLAYLGYLYQFKNYIYGVNAFANAMLFFVLDIPMFIVCFPLSVFLFNKRIKKLMNSQPAENELDDQKEEKEKRDDRKIIVDYLIFWLISLVCALFSYWKSH